MRLFANVLTQRSVAVKYRLHLHYHSRSAAVGRIVHAVMLVKSIVAYVAAVDFNTAALTGTSDNALAQNGAAHIGKQSQNINPHRQTAP